jgi:arginine decarboxylase
VTDPEGAEPPPRGSPTDGSPADSSPAGTAWADDAPLFAAWRRFAHSDAVPFTIPGHKRRAATLHPDLGRMLDADVPLHGGLDTVKLTSGVLREAERRAAGLWGADVCRFSVGGTTHTNQTLCLAVAGPGDAVLVGRNAHRSVLSGLVLAGLVPAWLPVQVSDRGEPLGVAPGTVEHALDQHPDAVALILTEPSYRGALSDLARTVTVAHDRDVPVLVDQAWGAHLGMAEGYPPHALQCGADAMVTSAHKMLPAFSQASLLLARRDRLSADRLERAFEATHTTSPSGAILASIDAARAFLGSPAGRVALERTAALVAGARARLRAAGLAVRGPEDHPPGRFDPAKLVVDLAADGACGLDVEAALIARGVPVEMADRSTVVAQVGLTDDAGTIERLVEGILGSVARAGGPAPPGEARAGEAWLRGLPSALPPQRMTPRDAFFAPFRAVPRAAAVGRVSAELVAPYPPGVPVLVPGEEITDEALATLDTALAAGNRIAYAADPTLATLQVVAGA